MHGDPNLVSDRDASNDPTRRGFAFAHERHRNAVLARRAACVFIILRGRNPDPHPNSRRLAMKRYQIDGTTDVPMTRDEIVEENALRFYVEDDHDARFTSAKKDCWFKADLLFNEARGAGELVVVIEDD